MGSKTLEEIRSLPNDSETNDLSFIIQLLTALDVRSIRNYTEELALAEFIKKQLRKEDAAFMEIVSAAKALPERLKTAFLNEYAMAMQNVYLIEFISTLSGAEPNPAVNYRSKIRYVDFAMTLLKEKQFFSNRTVEKKDVFLQAFEDDNVQMIKAFITNNELNLEYRNYYDETFIHLGARTNSPKILTYLAGLGQDVNAVNSFKQTPLHLCALYHSPEAALTLIENGAAINASDESQNTPLHIACIHNFSDIVSLLLKNGAKTDLKNRNGLSPLTSAVSGDGAETVALFLDRNLPPKALNLDYPLYFYAVSFSAEKVTALLKSRNIAYTSSENGYTLLHHAANINKPDFVKKFLDEGFHADVETKALLTPLFFASARGNMEIIEMLLMHGANINKRNQDGLTPLYYAVTSKNTSAAKYLIAHGAIVNSETNHQTIPLHDAVINKDLELIRLLVENGADIRHPAQKGITPFHNAVIGNDLDTVNYFLSVDPDCVKTDERSLSIAVTRKEMEMAKLLLNYRAPVNGITKPLLIAAKAKQFGMMDLLLDAGADPNCGSALGKPHFFVNGFKHPALFRRLKAGLKRSYRIKLKIASGFIVAIGLVFALLFSAMLLSDISLHQNGVLTQGRLIAKTVSGSDFEVQYAFSMNGTVYTHSDLLNQGKSVMQTVTASEYNAYAVGDIVSIRFCLNHPENNTLVFPGISEKSRFTDAWTSDLAGFIVPLGFFAVAFILIRKS